MAKLRPKKAWVTWKPKKKRYEVGVYWNRKVEVFYQYEGFSHITREIAELHKAEIETEIKRKTFNPEKHKKSPKYCSPYLFAEYCKIWLREYELRIKTSDISKEYVSQLARHFSLHVTPVLGDLDIREINTPVIQAFYLELSEKGYSKKYVQNIMDALKKFLGDAYDMGIISELIRFPKYKGRPQEQRWLRENRWLTEGEQDRVLQYCPRAHLPIVGIILYHGLRPAEARLAKRANFNKQEGSLFVETLKGGPGRKIFLHDFVLDLINRIPPVISHEYLFHHGGKKYSKTMLWKIMRKTLNDAGFPDVSPNQAGRHSFGSNWAAAGKPLPLIQYELGHADLRTTRIYMHVNPEDQKKWKRRSKRLSLR